MPRDNGDNEQVRIEDDPLGIAEQMRPVLKDASEAERAQILGGLQAAIGAATRSYLASINNAEADPQQRALREGYIAELANLRRGDAMGMVQLKNRYRKMGLRDV